MNRYRSDVPKAALACLATGLAAVTLAAFAVAPAVFDAGYDPAVTFATAGAIEVAISPARIEVVGVRAPDVAWALPDGDKRNCKPQG